MTCGTAPKTWQRQMMRADVGRILTTQVAHHAAHQTRGAVRRLNTVVVLTAASILKRWPRVSNFLIYIA